MRYNLSINNLLLHNDFPLWKHIQGMSVEQRDQIDFSPVKWAFVEERVGSARREEILKSFYKTLGYSPEKY